MEGDTREKYKRRNFMRGSRFVFFYRVLLKYHGFSRGFLRVSHGRDGALLRRDRVFNFEDKSRRVARKTTNRVSLLSLSLSLPLAELAARTKRKLWENRKARGMLGQRVAS